MSRTSAPGAPLTASQADAKARYQAKNGARIRQQAKDRRAAANAMPTLPIVQWALINSPTSVWAYAARSAS